MLSALRDLEARLRSPQPVPIEPSEDVTVVTISDRILVENAVRAGINVGFHNQFGASQILKNVITNPGFEAGQYGTIFLTEESRDPMRVQADHWKTEWNDDGLKIGQPSGFWEGAEYEVVYGNAIGRAGNVRQFTHENNKYTYYLTNGGQWFTAGDAVFVRKELPGYLGAAQKYYRADPNESRPGSPGTQSLRLLTPEKSWEWSYDYHMDSYWRDGDISAGKLMIIDGEWQLEVWAKGATNQSMLDVRFDREGEYTFFAASIQLSNKWQKIVRRFKVPEGSDRLGPYPLGVNRPILALKMRISNGGGWLDDLALFRQNQTNPTVFTDKYVNLLKELKPGVLRNWGKQLGSTLDNQLAEPFARKTTGYNPRNRAATDFHYSLPEFLQLAQEISAEPWYVIPPTFSTTDLRNLAAYLAAPVGSHPYADRRAELGQIAPWTDVFENIHLEYGNEMWGGNIGNDQFIGATLRGGERLGAVASARLGEFRASPYYQQAKGKFSLFIGGQANHPIRQQEIEQNSTNHDGVALAPYFGYLTEFENYQDTFGALFARSIQDVRNGIMQRALSLVRDQGSRTNLAVYEINFHTTTGDMPNAIRNDFVTGLAGALALPLYMLMYQRDLGVKCQAAFTSAQYSFGFNNPRGEREHVKLWGLMRDLERTGRKRPAWLGLQLANRAIKGNMLTSSHTGYKPNWQQQVGQGISGTLHVPFLHTFTFKDEDRWSMLIFNLDLTDAHQLDIKVHEPTGGRAKQHVLTAASIHDDNEDAENVRIKHFDLNVWKESNKLTVPPHSLTLIEWQSAKPVKSRIFMPVIRN